MKPDTQSKHICNSHKPTRKPKIAKELAFFNPDKKEIFKNVPTHDKKENKKTVNSSAFCSADSNFLGGQLADTDDNSTGHNSTLPQWRVTSKFERLCFLFTFVLGDSFVVLNPPLRQAANRYAQCYGDRFSIDTFLFRQLLK